MGVAGTQLSGGEARRLVIARGLLAETPILVLDEPTEGLDPMTERRVLDALLTRTESRTLILLTHRLAALDHMDEIVMLDHGHIVEHGVISDLMVRDGPFSRLFDRLPLFDPRVANL